MFDLCGIHSVKSGKHRDMAKFNDRLAIYLSVATIAFIAGAYITDDYLWGLVFALLSVLMTLIMTKVLPKRQKGVSLSQFTTMLLLEGKALSTAYLYRLYPPREAPQPTEGTESSNEDVAHEPLKEVQAKETETRSQRRPAKSAEPIAGDSVGGVALVSPRDAYYDAKGRYVVNALGYGKAGEEWAAKIYRTIRPSKVPVVVAAIDVDRKALATLGLVATDVKILRPKELLRRLKQAGVEPTYERKKERLSLKTLLGSLSYRHAYLFALSAAGCALFSLFLPIKIYYYVFASVNALLALAVLLTKKLFRE